MSDIFLSYAKEDRARAEVLAAALESLGWSVFWDRTVPAGLSWRDFIGKKLEEARSVVVAWSEASVKSQWVLEEAEEAKRRGILIPVLIQPIEPPFGFGALQAADLSSWDGIANAPALLKMVEDMTRVLGTPPGSLEKKTRQHAREAPAPGDVRSHHGAPSDPALVSGREGPVDQTDSVERGEAAEVEREGGRSMKTEKRGSSALWIASAAGVLVVALLWFVEVAPLKKRTAALGRTTEAGIAALEERIAELEGRLQSGKVVFSTFTTDPRDCGKLNDPCEILFSPEFASVPHCVVTAWNPDGEPYAENPVIERIEPDRMRIWRGVDNQGTTIVVSWICVENPS